MHQNGFDQIQRAAKYIERRAERMEGNSRDFWRHAAEPSERERSQLIISFVSLGWSRLRAAWERG